MTISCEVLESRYILEGEEILLSDPALQQHLEECAHCRALYVTLTTIDEELAKAPEYDVPEHVVQQVLSKVRIPGIRYRLKRKVTIDYPTLAGVVVIIVCGSYLIGSNSAGMTGLSGPVELASSVISAFEGSAGALLMLLSFLAALVLAGTRRVKASASLLTLSVCCFMVRSMQSTFFDDRRLRGGESRVDVGAGDPNERWVDLADRFNMQLTSLSNESKQLKEENSALKKNMESYEETTAEIFKKILERLADVNPGSTGAGAAKSSSEPRIFHDYNVGPPNPDALAKREKAKSALDTFAQYHRALPKQPVNPVIMPQERKESKKDVPAQVSSELLDKIQRIEPEGLRKMYSDMNGSKVPVMGQTFAMIENGAGNEYLQALNDRELDYSERQLKVRDVKQLADPTSGVTRDSDTPTPPSPPITFKSPTGYWYNTYTPGDPLLLTLDRVLHGDQKALFTAGFPDSSFLETLAMRPEHPFDRPTDSALGLSVNADHTTVNGETRMLVQIGLAGAKRAAGSRPPMNAMLILDLSTEPTPEERESLQKIVWAFERNKQPGDRFGLIISGCENAPSIPLGELRHGTVSVAIASAFSCNRNGKSSILSAVLRSASEVLASATDGTAGFGSNLVMIASATGLSDADGETVLVDSAAHQSTLRGVTVSALAVGDRASLPRFDTVVGLGEGNRRIVAKPSDASFAVERELGSAGRAVARAVRLKIKLAPGVKLVDVLGSKSLDEESTTRVRAAEQAIDQRAQRSLGIQADRGKDEDGIQIVIPAFYADDTHGILLDVVVPQPGPIAEVSARYKDLVYLRNGISTVALSLPAGEAVQTPQSRAVTYNRIAYSVSQALAQASTLPPQDAERLLRETATMIVRLNAIINVSHARTEAQTTDSTLLLGFSKVVGALSCRDCPDSLVVKESLQSAAKLRVLPNPEWSSDHTTVSSGGKNE